METLKEIHEQIDMMLWIKMNQEEHKLEEEGGRL